MPKKEEQKGGKQEATTKTKELKISAVQVVTREAVLKNQRQMSLLYIIDALGPMHERTVHEVVKRIQEMGAGMNYNFVKLGEDFHSPELKNDLISLTYVGFLETDIERRKIRTTGDGKEALEKHGAPQGIVKLIEENKDVLKNAVILSDSKIDLEIRKRRETRRREGFTLRDLLR